MKTKTLLSLLILPPLLLSFGAEAGVKETISQKLVRFNKPNKGNEFQLLVQFSLPEIPKDAEIINAILILDQSFELDQAQGREAPKGFVNRTGRTFLISVYGVQGSPNEWVDLAASKSNKLSSSGLAQPEVIQSERREGRWGNQAAEFAVTTFIKNKVGLQNRDASFIISAGRANNGLKASDIEVNVTKLAGRLVIVYAEEPPTSALDQKEVSSRRSSQKPDLFVRMNWLGFQLTGIVMADSLEKVSRNVATCN